MKVWQMARDATGIYYSYKELTDVKSLCDFARQLDARHVFPATSGNLSVRTNAEQFLITRSGYHKKMSTPAHFLRVNISTALPITRIAPKPSDETKLHAAIYRLFPEINSILHCHVEKLDSLKAPNFIYAGHELLKAIGYKTHTEAFCLPVFQNSQDMDALSKEIQKHFSQSMHKNPCAFQLERHGIYCFGKSPQHAMNVVEVFLHI